MLKRLDANDDGKLSAEEMAARGPARLFDRLDADEDGAITREELAEARGMKRGGWGKRGHGDRDDN
jgi:Ca2+-binding EF-hand superfamily protein